MATYEKTIKFAIPALASLSDDTLTALTQIDLYIPEFGGAITFKHVIIMVGVMQGATTTTDLDYTTRTVEVSVGGASASSYAAASTMSDSAENYQAFSTVDCTAHFVSNWTSGTDTTLDVAVRFHATGTTVVHKNVYCEVYITYEFSSAQTTQIKTLHIPLNAPTGYLDTSKPGSAVATIPQLTGVGGLLKEDSPVIRSMYIVIRGSTAMYTIVGDGSITQEIDSSYSYEIEDLEGDNASDYSFWIVWDLTTLGISSSSAHDWYIYADQARYPHLQAYLVVTYEYNDADSTEMTVGVLLPLHIMDQIKNVGVTYEQIAQVNLLVEEPGVITTMYSALYMANQTTASSTYLYCALGGGSYVNWTGAVSIVGGSAYFMLRDDSAYSLVRGNNTLDVHLYGSALNMADCSFSGFLMLVYTASKPAGGTGAANHTVTCCHRTISVGTASYYTSIASWLVDLPETEYFISDFGIVLTYHGPGVTVVGDWTEIAVQKEGGGWEVLMLHPFNTDNEQGIFSEYSHWATDVMIRWPGDVGRNRSGGSRLDFATSRLLRIWQQGAGRSAHLETWITYHSITFTVAGTIGIGATGTLDLFLEREVSTGVWEHVLTDTMEGGDGAYSFTWYDDTQKVHVRATDGTLRGVSKDGYAS